MNKKWSSDKVKDVQRLMKKRWPDAFTHGPDLRPLSLHIHKEILEHREEYPQLSGRVVREVLKRHTTSYGYLYGMLKNDKRYDLDNKPVGEVSAEHREWARRTLRMKQKLAQKIRKDAQKKHREQNKSAVRTPLVTAAVDNTQGTNTNPVIRYKPTKRRLIKPKAESTVDMAS